MIDYPGKVKPIVKIKDAYLVRSVVWDEKGQRQCYVLVGITLDYPDEHMVYQGCVTNKTAWIQTSEVIEVQGNVVKTQRTEYHVLNWLTEPDFQTTLGAQFGKDGLTQT